MGIAVDYQLHRASVMIAKGGRQMQKAAAKYSKGNDDSGAIHLAHALKDYSSALDHARKAEGDVVAKISKEIDKGNAELQKSIDAYANGGLELAQIHFDKASDHYGKVLDLFD